MNSKGLSQEGYCSILGMLQCLAVTLQCHKLESVDLDHIGKDSQSDVVNVHWWEEVKGEGGRGRGDVWGGGKWIID